MVLDGFTFETPGICGVYAPKGRVTVRNCWSVGCHTLVAGDAVAAYNDACADVLLENCDHSERGVMQDVRDVLTLVNALTAAQQAALPGLFWWHRKGGSYTYETGIVVGAANSEFPPGTTEYTRYEPYPGMSGTDTFTYTISNQSGQTATATVTVTLNNKPVLVNDSRTVQKNVPTTINVLANDSDPEGDPLTITTTSTPSKGTVTIVTNQLRHTGTTTGSDTFTYTVSDGRGGTSTATVTIQVNP